MWEIVSTVGTWLAWGGGILLVVAFLGGAAMHGDEGSDEE